MMNIAKKLKDSDESMNKKIKISNKMKNPYTLIIGNNEIENELVSYRKLGSEETVSMKINEFVEMIKNEIKEK